MNGQIDPRYARPLGETSPTQAPKVTAAPPGRLARIFASLVRTRIDKSTWRIRLVALGFAGLFCVIGGRLVYLGMKPEPQSLRRAASEAVSRPRPDLLDRNGEILATDIKVMSVFAEPRRIIDKDEAVELLTAVFPDLNATELRARLASRKGFVWVKRGIKPKEQEDVFRLGLPGIGFLPENKRVYPNGPVGAHVIGFTNLDNSGIAGIEKYLDGQGLGDLTSFGLRIKPADLKPVQLSIDLRVTHAVRDELEKGIEKFKAKAGASAIIDVNTGEVIALASLPDYNPNNPSDALEATRINRMNVGVYEMGSTFKAISIAMALESNKVNLNSRVDARENLRYGGFSIGDFHAQRRILSVPEVFTYSSNIGTAKMALMVGVEGHKDFLRRIGQLDRLRTELPESAEPLVPKRWAELSTVTIAYGHGLNVAPLQAMMAVGALVNGGKLVKPTFLMRSEEEAKATAPQIVRPEVSEALRFLMRLNAEKGSARNVDVPGYYVGGKTGTAEKSIRGRYQKDKVFTTFMAVAPADKPKYLYLTLLDEPQGVPETHGQRTAAWNSGAVTGQIIRRTANLLDLPPRLDLPTQPFPLLARMGFGQVQPGPKGNL